MSDFDFQRIEDYLQSPDSDWLNNSRLMGGTFIPFYGLNLSENRVQLPNTPDVGHTFSSKDELVEFLRGEMLRLTPGVSMLKDQWQKNMPHAEPKWILVSMQRDGSFYLMLQTSQGKIDVKI